MGTIKKRELLLSLAWQWQRREVRSQMLFFSSLVEVSAKWMTRSIDSSTSFDWEKKDKSTVAGQIRLQQEGERRMKNISNNNRRAVLLFILWLWSSLQMRRANRSTMFEQILWSFGGTRTELRERIDAITVISSARRSAINNRRRREDMHTSLSLFSRAHAAVQCQELMNRTCED